MKNRLFAFLLLLTASGISASAITITNKVVTDDLFSFDFAGTGSMDFISNGFGKEGPWVVGSESHFATQQDYAFFLGAARNGFDVGLYTGNVPVGQAFSVTTSVDLADGVDTYLFQGFVNVSLSDGWGPYSGSFLATHSAKVPDTGNVGLLVGAILAGTSVLSRVTKRHARELARLIAQP